MSEDIADPIESAYQEDERSERSDIPFHDRTEGGPHPDRGADAGRHEEDRERAGAGRPTAGERG